MFISLLFTLLHSASFSLLCTSISTNDLNYVYFQPHSVSFDDLFLQDSATTVQISNILATYGILQIVGIPNFANTRTESLSSLAACLKNDDSQKMSKTMSDGSVRLTSQAASVHGRPGEMSSHCGDPAKKLRALVDASTRQLFLALDKASGETNSRHEPVMAPYQSYDALMRGGEHLEHLHAYFSAEAGAQASAERATVDFHTDAGLLIAMTAGFYSGAAPSEASGLYIQMPTGAKARAVVAEDALIVMVGDGGARWLAPVSGAPLRAVPHALVADLEAGSQATRSWYGKMYLPPSDAVVPQEGISFARYQQLQSDALAAAKAQSRHFVSDYSAFLPSACGGDALSFVLTSSTDCVTADGDPGITCWMTCQSVASLPCGQSAECVNPATGALSNGDTETCSKCKPQCPAQSASPVFSATNLSSGVQSTGFCYGPGVIMFMEGFASLLGGRSGATACLNFLVVGWSLDSPLKFALACAATLLMGVAVHYLTLLRVSLPLSHKPGSRRYNAIALLLHAVQVLLGYFLMLVAMTYSVELFCMVLLGLSAGYALFNLQLLPDVESTDPCCSGGDFDAEPASDERTPIAGQRGVAMVYMQAERSEENL